MLMGHVGLPGCADDEWKNPHADCETGSSVFAMMSCSADAGTIMLGTYEDAACAVIKGELSEDGAAQACFSEQTTGTSSLRFCSAGFVVVSKYASADCSGEPMETFDDACHDICQDSRFSSGASPALLRVVQR
jgi:hypothetical protein